MKSYLRCDGGHEAHSMESVAPIKNILIVVHIISQKCVQTSLHLNLVNRNKYLKVRNGKQLLQFLNSPHIYL